MSLVVSVGGEEVTDHSQTGILMVCCTVMFFAAAA